MTTTADRPASGNGLSRAEREKMLAGVENLIVSWVCKSAVDVEDREDVIADIRCRLWELLERFDPSGRAKWSSYAGTVTRTMLRAHLSRRGEGVKTVGFRDGITADPAAVADDDEPDDDLSESASALTTAVRKQLARPALDALGPNLRRLVEAVVFGGLTVDQYATQNGQPVKAVKTNLGTAIGKLVLAGHVPERMAARLGINLQPYRERADVGLKAAKTTARRELVAEAVALGWPTSKIAVELGEPESAVIRDVQHIRAAHPAEATAV